MELILALLVVAVMYAPEYCERERARWFVAGVIGTGLLITLIVVAVIFLFKTIGG
jgi:hypothetical protein